MTLRPTLAVLGMGNMGRALARRLLERNYAVVIWNRSPRDQSDLTELGARELTSLSDLWATSDAAITFVSNDQALRDVCMGPAGIVRDAPKGRLVIDMSTVSLRVSEEVAEATRQAGIEYLRSPVSGNPQVLASGNLTLIVSGPENVLERWSDVLYAIGPNVLYVGPGEEARLVKLAVNAGLAITTELLAELIILTEHYGLDRSVFLEALGQSVLGSSFVRYKAKGFVERDYSATFTTALLAKDLRLALDLADGAELALPTVQLVASLVDAALDGYANVDFSALLPHQQRTQNRLPDLLPEQRRQSAN